MDVRYFIKTHLNNLTYKSKAPIVVASMGRAGSTLVWNSVVNSTANDGNRFLPFNFRQRLASASTFDINIPKFSRGMVYKTHAYPENLPLTKDTKVIFLFGSAKDAVLSVDRCRLQKGEHWYRKHLQNLQVSYVEAEQLYKFDALGIKKQIQSWQHADNVPRMILRYESIWEYTSEISEFLDLDIQLPVKTQRQSKLNALKNDPFSQTYNILEQWIDEQPNYKLLGYN